ncbi:MAG: FprA family A-type flavoprotein [Clostridiales bacterium]|nr:FprA family A-type flavoprotein [Clostridiales bacterium]
MEKILDSLYSVGVQDPGLRTFDIIMNTPNGSTYNAYLLKGSEKTVLIETAKAGFSDEYFANIQQITSLDKIDYLIVNHTEPDHAGTIPLLLERNPNITVIGTTSGIAFVTNIIKDEFKSRVVKKGDTLDLGDRKLEFYPMPNLHWPDTMFTFDPVNKTLFTCDFFGAHYAYPDLLLSRMEDKSTYRESFHQYFMDIMFPFRSPFVTNGIKAAKELAPKMICTGHGPILDTDLEYVYEKYTQWAQLPEHAKGKTVVIVYVSAYEYTKSMAMRIAKTLEDKGLHAHIIDPTKEELNDVISAVSLADGILFGSPTFLGDMLKPIGEVLTALYPFMVSGKPVSAFGSYGWSGEAVENITQRAKQLKMKTMDGIRIRLRPSEEELDGVEEFASQFAMMLK